jgi:hypothetical protein
LCPDIVVHDVILSAAAGIDVTINAAEHAINLGLVLPWLVLVPRLRNTETVKGYRLAFVATEPLVEMLEREAVGGLLVLGTDDNTGRELAD